MSTDTPVVSIKDRIREADDIDGEPIDVPEWGVKLEIRSATATERSRLIGEFIDPVTQAINYGNMYPALLIATSYDPDSGDKVFTAEDADWLGGKSGAVMERVARVALRMCGLDEEAVDRGKADSSGTTNGDTPSDSQSDSAAP